MLETLIGLSVVLLLGLSVVQWAFVYEARAVVSHATYMAARSGAVNEAKTGPMRIAFARTITPLFAPEPSTFGFEQRFLGKSSIEATLYTRLRILNPTKEAFTDFGITDSQGQFVLPFSHLKTEPETPGPASGLSIYDATLLRVEVTYGVPLNVPFAGPMIIQSALAAGRIFSHFDAYETALLSQNRLPIQTTSTVRLHTNALPNSTIPTRSEVESQIN
nr:hypothetical protein [Spiribacter salilacus]